MDDWGHVLGALVLLIDETFDSRKTVHDVGAAAHSKEIKVMQTTISKLLTAVSKTDAAAKALKCVECPPAPGAMWAKSSKTLPDGKLCEEGTCDKLHTGHKCQKSHQSVHALSYIWKNPALLEKTESSRKADAKKHHKPYVPLLAPKPFVKKDDTAYWYRKYFFRARWW